jgi:hypothetical protein
MLGAVEPQPECFLLRFFRRGHFRHELQGLLDQNLARLFAQARPRHVVVGLKAAPIDASQDLAECVVAQAEEQVVFAAHIAFEIEPDGQQVQLRADLRRVFCAPAWR